jgi:hypothetical protein
MRWLSLSVVLLGCASTVGGADAPVIDVPTIDAPVLDAPPSPVLRQPPTRPGGAEEPDGPAVALALRDAFLDQGVEWASTGLDLDGLDTRAGSPEAECASMVLAVDGEGGIDNVVGESLYPLLEAAIPGLEALANDAFENGRGNLVVAVSGWDATSDDPHVDASLVRAMVITSAGDAAPPVLLFPAPGEATLPGGGPVPPPDWDGGDWAWARTDSLLGGDPDRALVNDGDAYVAGGVLVMRLPERVEVAVGVLALRLTGGLLLVGPLGAPSASATLVGRWSNADFLSAMAQVGVCPGTAQHELLAAQLDRVADLRAAPGTTGPCDAVSIGVGLSATPVRVAGAAEGAAAPISCP